MSKHVNRPIYADTAKERILEALKIGPKTAVELSNPEIGGLRYTARIHELREEGWIIRSEPISGKTYLRYRLDLKYTAPQKQMILF